MNIVEFSKKAGLSTATVSRAFHEPGKVREATRNRVMELARQLRYYPDPGGRSLVKGHYDTLGLVWPLEVEGPQAVFAQRILSELTRELVNRDLDLLICPLNRSQPGTLEHARRSIPRSRCDGWILLYPRRDDQLAEAFRHQRKPLIGFLGRVPDLKESPAILLDQRHWIRDACKRLKALGVKRTLFLGCRPGEPDHQERLEAFTQIAPRYFTTCLTHPFWPIEQEPLLNLIRKHRIQAIIGVDDTAALKGLQAAQTAGIRIPHSLKVVGIDGAPEGQRTQPTLASYRQPLGAMCAAAVARIFDDTTPPPSFRASFVPGETLS